ncbi:ArsR/SmtB family transcription factor [Parasphingorhabdus sp.]|uniref:ArsR/SmtB family transcription factor n=1 Tax=Parasphingorhabdus sp. TaxID=2709688 RepID=UPI003C77DD2B
MTAIFESRDHADAATEKLKVFAQPQRLMILSYLLRGENTVSEIDAATGIGQPALSQQLATLRRSEIVKTRREGKQIWYGLADDASRLCVQTMEALLIDKPDPQRVMEAAASRGLPAEKPLTGAGAAGFAKIL